MTMSDQRISRRQLLRASCIAGAGLMAVACQPKVIEVTRVVEKEVEKVVTQEVVKKETVVVTQKEVQEKVVTPTRAPKQKGAVTTIRYGTFWPMWRIEILNQGISIFQKQFPEIAVAVEMGGGSFRDKLTTQFAAGTEPDTGITNVYDMQRFYDQNLCLDLLPACEAKQIDIRKDYRLQGVEFSGEHLYGMPWVTFAHGIFYNKTMFKEAGAPDPYDDLGGYWTWDQFLTACKALKEKTGKFPIEMALNSLYYQAPEFVYGNCGRLYDFANSKYALNEPATVAAIQWIVDNIVKTGYAIDAESSKAATLAGMLDVFSGGAVAMTKQSTGYVKQTLDRVKDSFEWDIARCPTMNGGKDETMSFVSADPNFVSANTVNRDEAVQFILFLAGDDMQNILSKNKLGICSLNRAAQIEGGFLAPPPKNIAMMLEPWASKRILPAFFHYNCNAAQKVMTREMDYVVLEKKTVQEACDVMQKECNDLIEFKTKFVPESQWVIDFPASAGYCK